MRYDVVINGRILGKRLNGIPRFAKELLSSLDEIVPNNIKVCVVSPSFTYVSKEFKRLKVVELPAKRNWDFSCAERFARKNEALYINLANKGALYRNSVAVIHDVRPLKIKKTSKFTSRLKFWISFRIATTFCKRIITVSNFCKNEIETLSKRRDVLVISNGWEHMERIEPDYSIFKDYEQLKDGDYILSIGSLAPHKRLDIVEEFARKNHNIRFVVVGGADKKLWNEAIPTANNLIFVGFQSDARMKALLEKSRFLLFPSSYEGFGIPPLEAMSLSVPSLVSDIPVMREVFGESVCYIGEDRIIPSVDKEHLKPLWKETLSKYSWKNAALKFLSIVLDALKE